MQLIVVDLEMNPIASCFKEKKRICRSEIIQFGAVRLDDQYKEIDQFQCLVKPQFNEVIEKRFEKLTGITTEMVQDAVGFAEAFEMFCDWCFSQDEEIEVYAWSDSDLAQVKHEILLKGYESNTKQNYLLSHWYDFQREFDEKIGFGKQVSLLQAITYAGEDFSGDMHNALADARNTAILMKLFRNQDSFDRTLKKIKDALEPSPSATMGDLFDFSGITFPET